MVGAARNSQNISRDTSTKDEVQIDHHEHATIVGVRIVVEWVFKEITQQFAYLSWKREQKVFLKASSVRNIRLVFCYTTHMFVYIIRRSCNFFERENGHLVRPFDDGALFHPPGLLSARG
jgi:hypothetical protein